MSSSERKSPGLAAALSVLLPGIGQIYLGQAGLGIGYILAAIVGYSLFVLPGIIVLVVSAIHAYKTAQRKNRNRNSEAHRRSEAEKIARKKQAEVNELKKQKNTINSESFIERVEKLSKLHTHDVLDHEEYKERKKQAISELGRKKIDADPEDFLFELKDLKGHVLDGEDFQAIKQRIL